MCLDNQSLIFNCSWGGGDLKFSIKVIQRCFKCEVTLCEECLQWLLLVKNLFLLKRSCTWTFKVYKWLVGMISQKWDSLLLMCEVRRVKNACNHWKHKLCSWETFTAYILLKRVVYYIWNGTAKLHPIFSWYCGTTAMMPAYSWFVGTMWEPFLNTVGYFLLKKLFLRFGVKHSIWM